MRNVQHRGAWFRLRALAAQGVPALLVLAGMLAGAAALAHAPSGQVAPLIVDQAAPGQLLGKYTAVLEDPSTGLTIEDVRSPRFAPSFRPAGVGVMNFGYTASAWWLCFTLVNRDALSRERLLEVRYPSIDAIEVYAPGADGQMVVQRGGDRQPFTGRRVQNRNHVFPMTLAAGAETTVFVRLASSSVLTAPVHLWAPEAFAAQERDTQMLLGLFYGLVLALVLYNLMLFVALRERIYLVYVAYASSFSLFLFSFDGLAFQYLWPESVWLANHALATSLAASMLFGAMLAREFLSMREQAPWIDLWMRGTMVAGGVLVLAAATGAVLSYSTVLRSISLIGIVTAALALWVAVRSLLRGFRPARFFLLAWSAMIVFICLGALRNFALVPSNVLTIYGLHFGLVVDVLFLSFALADRISLLRSRTRRAEDDVRSIRDTLVETRRRSDQMLKARIVERTAELHDANAHLRTEVAERDALMRELREREERMRFMAQNDPLTGLPNRLSMQQRLELALQFARRNRRKLAVLMVDLKAFKALNDTRGHLVGDQALAAVAGRLRMGVRGADTVARYGGDEFVVLAGDLDRSEDAGMIAEKICDTVNVPLALEGGMARLACAIGISVFPDDGESGEALLGRAEQALTEAKAASETRWAYYAPVN